MDQRSMNDDLASVASTNATNFRRVTVADNRAVEEGIRAGNINISNVQNTNIVTVGFSSDNQESIRRHQELQRKYELDRQARNIRLPTTDADIKAGLRELGEPAELLSEQTIERSERLRLAILKYVEREGRLPSLPTPNRIEQAREVEEEFYTPGSAELKSARIEIAKYSIPLTAYRLEKSRRQRLISDRLDDELKYEAYISTIGEYDIVASQYADERCVSRGDLSYDNQFYATSGWSGDCKVWGIPD